MKVRIPFVVNPAGRWAAGGYPGIEKDPDWGFLMDQADGEEANSDFQRGWIEVDLPQPSAAITITGSAQPSLTGPAEPVILPSSQ